ncbi:MAG TPA: hypothetical protein VLU95_00340 [Candidatus Acidoferrum sp.]|nr:hypothetical protein [Candidatus Acidoferrum sp.]
MWLCLPVSAQLGTVLNTPSFTVRHMDNSYVVPAAYGIDPYTGKNITTEMSYYIVNNSLIVSIKNQPFTPYSDNNGNYISMYYNVSAKGHYGDSWSYYYHYQDSPNDYISASSSGLTNLVFGLQGNNGSNYYNLQLGSIPPSGQVDFRVQSYLAYITVINITPSILPFQDHSNQRAVLTVIQSSGLSPIQTITMPAGSSPPTNMVPEFSALAATVLVIFVIGLAVEMVIKKVSKRTTLKFVDVSCQ